MEATSLVAEARNKTSSSCCGRFSPDKSVRSPMALLYVKLPLESAAQMTAPLMVPDAMAAWKLVSMVAAMTGAVGVLGGRGIVELF